MLPIAPICCFLAVALIFKGIITNEVRLKDIIMLKGTFYFKGC